MTDLSGGAIEAKTAKMFLTTLAYGGKTIE